jgi:hypothetical protein
MDHLAHRPPPRRSPPQRWRPNGLAGRLTRTLQAVRRRSSGSLGREEDMRRPSRWRRRIPARRSGT